MWTPKSRNLGSFLVWHIQMCVNKMTRSSQQILGRRKCRCLTMKCTSHLERTKQHITTNTSFQQLSMVVEGLWSGSSCSDILCIPKCYSLKCEDIFVTTKAWLKLMYESKSATEWLKKTRIIVSKFRPQSNWNSVVGSWKSWINKCLQTSTNWNNVVKKRRWDEDDYFKLILLKVVR